MSRPPSHYETATRKLVEQDQAGAGILGPLVDKNFLYYVVICSFILMLGVSCVVNFTFFAVLISSRKQFFNRPYFVLLSQLLVANILLVVCNFVCALPLVTFLSTEGANAFAETTFWFIFNNLDRLAKQLIDFFSVLIAIHRTYVFFIQNKTDSIFEGFSFICMIILCWLFSILIATFLTVFDCWYTLHITGLIQDFYWYEFKCNFKDESYTSLVQTIYMTQKIAFPTFVLVLYVSIVVKLAVTRMRTSSSQQNAEKSFLLQSVVIYVVFQVSTGTTILINSIDLSKEMAFLARWICSTTDLVAGSLAPLFVILFCKEVRTIVMETLGFGSGLKTSSGFTPSKGSTQSFKPKKHREITRIRHSH